MQGFNAAWQLAEESSQFRFSNAAQGVGSDAGGFLQNSENLTVANVGQATSFGLGMIGAVKTIYDVANAYSAVP